MISEANNKQMVRSVQLQLPKMLIMHDKKQEKEKKQEKKKEKQKEGHRVH